MATQPRNSAKHRAMAVGQKETPTWGDPSVPFLSEYGPGSVDYIEWRDPRQIGPLIDIWSLLGGEKDPAKAEEIFRYPRTPNSWNKEIPATKRKPVAVASNSPSPWDILSDVSIGNAKQPWSDFAAEPYPLEHGPGSTDYIQKRDRRQPGPLIDPAQIYRDETGKGADPQDIQDIFFPPRSYDLPDPPSSPKEKRYRQQSSLDTGTRTDAMAENTPTKPTKPAQKQRSVAGAKGDMEPPSTDPFSMMADALMDLFTGAVPSPGMGGGVTQAPKGLSPYTQQPAEADLPIRNPFFTSGPDETMLASMLQGPGSTHPKNVLSPMEQNAAATPPAISMTPPTPNVPNLTPPVPTPNPQFHAEGGPDLRNIGIILEELFGGGKEMGQVPTRNPMFTGGV